MKSCKHHKDKKHYGLGLCRTCWDRERRWKSRGINITTEEYELMLKKQNGTCLFCDRTPRKHRALDVDHDHKNGRIRGLLCNEHNRAIGVIEKNIENIDKMVKFIRFQSKA